MRKIILGVGISLDGYLARPDGNIDFLVEDEEDSSASFFANVDTQVMGRKTYEAGLRFGAIYGTMETVVFSRSAAPGMRDAVTFTAESPARVVEQLRAREGKNVWLAGGGEITREFLRADLIDEIHLGIMPVLIGEGIPLFPPPFPQRQFTLVENQTCSDGIIGLKYKRTDRL